MSATPAIDAPQPSPPPPLFEDSRRLIGANLHFDRPAVVLTALGPLAADSAAHARWAAAVSSMAAALGWPAPQPHVQRHVQPHAQPHLQPHGNAATLAFVAPSALLFTATEVNEWAWEQALGDAAAGFEIRHRGLDVAAFSARAGAEFSPPLARLRAAAAEHQLPCLEDDETLSIGAGSGSVSYPRAALPLAMDVPWSRLHDVPTILVTGSNGKTTTTRLIAAIATASGKTCGLCGTEGIVVGGARVGSGDFAGPAGARAVLRHPAVQVAVLETARGGLLRRGLAVQRADIAVVTNISADHFGEYGMHSLDDIAQAKLIVAHAVAAGGVLVLNAGDTTLMRAAARWPHAAQARQALFALDFDAEPLRAHRAMRGTVNGTMNGTTTGAFNGSTCGLRAGELWLSIAAQEHALGPAASMPLTLGGAAGFNIENAAAAALAAAAAGFSVDTIRSTLASFGGSACDNPGRLERWSHRGATVLVDYAHNPDGLAQLLQIARALQPARLGLLLGQAGNRDDGAITDLARTAAGFAPDRVLIKELPQMLRGRAVGEVPALIEQALLDAGLERSQIRHEADEEAAALRLLDWARAGDVIVLPVHTAAVRERLVARFAAWFAAPVAAPLTAPPTARPD